MWIDPPQYFDKIVWPGYLKAHAHIFEDPAVGELKQEWGPKGRDLHVIKPGKGEEGMTEAFDECCEAIVNGVKDGRGIFLA